MTKVAFIGLGSMGAPLAKLIAKGGHDLSVYDPFPKATEAFEGVARIASSPADCAAGIEVACICVRDDAQVRDVLFGENGMADALAQGALVAIHSTIAVEALKDIASKLAEKDIATIDAPVSRTRQTTDDAFVYCMLGGEAEDIERSEPVVQTFATEFSHMGGLGAGMATKITNNMVTWVQIVIALQGATLAIKSGVELDQLLTVMRANGNLTPTMGAIIGGKLQAPSSPEREELFASQGGIGEKDLLLALETAEKVGLDTQMIREAQGLVRGLMAGPSVY
ncbi:NAD(P)-dependent oxidoreductase [Erythrobacter litoralis]|uniref:NAD(P)-dependent oxidoreductase n=1 Tax=Erythrobacter litoralis TaxID=39960 RepID=UPI002435DCFC|nr:NAD(P)-dependent oxidoreductase [Erythrobacter litoralis]MDG6079884.1 NAD(P)-dependent oxidoreductase [Erythrobacter litoralis]